MTLATKDLQNPRITQLKKTEAKALPEALLIVGSTSKLKATGLKRVFEAETAERIEAALKLQAEEMKAGASLAIPAAKSGEPSIYLSALKDSDGAFESLGFARDQLKLVLKAETKNLGIVFLDANLEKELCDYFAVALAARVFQMPLYGKKAKEAKAYKLKQAHFFTAKDQRKKLAYGFETGEGTNLVRSLACTPANYLNPEIYGKEIQKLCKAHKLQTKFISNAQLKKMGAGAFTAVDKGDPNSKGGIWEITYNGRGAKNKKPVALVGKGLCFDTGGYDVKTQGFMAQMKADMTGSAVALSSILTAARLKLPAKMKVYLGLTENHISPKAYKADDVIIALNGLSIEVVNTDAEGRMVLADTLTIASRAKPHMIVDFATLTGAAVYSIGTHMSAGFTNREDLHDEIIASGWESGERVWTFPTEKDYEKYLESPVADTLQCSRGRGGDHMLAAIFLSKFVENDVPWVHIDLSCAENKGGLGATDTEYTGFGVRWTLEFLRSQLKIA